MTNEQRRYLALGDSMSIDLYTGVPGGGAVGQFYDWLKWLGQGWSLENKTYDGCCMSGVDASAIGDLITLTIGGNDLLAEADKYLSEGLASFADAHLNLLDKIRAANPDAFVIVGNIYAPQTKLTDELARALDEVNAIIAANTERIGAHLADIRSVFRGNENDYLCYDIEPSHKGATIIARLFKEIVVKAGGLR